MARQSNNNNTQSSNAVFNVPVAVKRCHWFDDHSAVFDLEIPSLGVTIYGMRLVDKDGKDPFVTGPQQKGKDGKWYNHIYIAKWDETLLQGLIDTLRKM